MSMKKREYPINRIVSGIMTSQTIKRIVNHKILIMTIMIIVLSNPITAKEERHQKEITPTNSGYFINCNSFGNLDSHDYSVQKEIKRKDPVPHLTELMNFSSWDEAMDYIPFNIEYPTLDNCETTIVVQGDNNTFHIECDYDLDTDKSLILKYTFYKSSNWSYETKYNGKQVLQTVFTNDNGFDFCVVRMLLDEQIYSFYGITVDDMLCQLEFCGFEEQEEQSIVNQFKFNEIQSDER